MPQHSADGLVLKEVLGWAEMKSMTKGDEVVDLVYIGDQIVEIDPDIDDERSLTNLLKVDKKYRITISEA